MGELHLEILVDRMKREFKRRGNRRQAAGCLPRNDPRQAKRCDGKFVKQSGGRGQYGHAVISSSRTEQARATKFGRDQGWCVPREYIPAVDKGIQEALKAGVLAGFPVVDVKAR